MANVSPIYKKGSKEDPGNYRPISLTSSAGKLVESVIVMYIVEFLEVNNLILDSQHGFRRGRSCLTNLLEFFNDILFQYDRTRAVDVVYLDFKKAFDKVPHKRLMMKLYALGIRGNLHVWIDNWLTGRRQRVVLNGCCSEWQPVTSGVPQGSVLGPILFLIYINDLDLNITSTLMKLADDTKIGNKVDTSQGIQVLQNDLQLLEEWSVKW